MIVMNTLGFFVLIFLSLLQRTLAIMVPTGKVGPITPRKVVPEVAVVQQPLRDPAPVWERVDEGPNPYHPPVYKYTLLDFARKYGRKTLIPPPEEEYYRTYRIVATRDEEEKAPENSDDIGVVCENPSNCQVPLFTTSLACLQAQPVCFPPSATAQTVVMRLAQPTSTIMAPTSAATQSCDLPPSTAGVLQNQVLLLSVAGVVGGGRPAGAAAVT